MCGPLCPGTGCLCAESQVHVLPVSEIFSDITNCGCGMRNTMAIFLRICQCHTLSCRGCSLGSAKVRMKVHKSSVEVSLNSLKALESQYKFARVSSLRRAII